MKLKNVIIINDFDYIQGGASKVAIQTANIIATNNDNIKVYYFSGNHIDSSMLEKNITKICTNQQESLKDHNKLRGTINGLYNFKAKRKLKELLSTLDNNETIINIHGWTKVLSSSVFDIAFKMDFKVVLTLHDYFTACPNGGYFNYKKNVVCKYKQGTWSCAHCNCDSRNYAIKLYRILRQFIQREIVGLNRKLEYCVGISDFSINILKRELPKAKIKKIYNPIDFDDVKNVHPEDNKYYVYVGRLSQEKGIITLCEQMKEYDNFLVIGDGPLKQELENKYPNISFVGWKNKEEITDYLKNTRILILPSLWYEGAPLVPLEAMNYGIPCIISDKCAAIEYIENKNGEIYNTDDKTSLIHAINEIEKNITSYSKNAEQYVFQRKNDNYYENIVQYFFEVIDNHEKN